MLYSGWWGLGIHPRIRSECGSCPTRATEQRQAAGRGNALVDGYIQILFLHSAVAVLEGEYQSAVGRVSALLALGIIRLILPSNSRWWVKGWEEAMKQTGYGMGSDPTVQQSLLRIEGRQGLELGTTS